MSYQKASRVRKPEPLLALAAMDDITDLQKSAALELAAYYSRGAENPIIEQIPLETVRKTARMQQLLNQGGSSEVIVEFADEAISQWPFWKRGDGFRLRGRAYSILKEGEKAESDLSEAIPWVSDPRTVESVWLALAQNRERNLGDDDGALGAYDAIVAGKERIGGANQYYALQGIAHIQTKKGQFEEALKTLERANVEKLQGSWKKNILQSIEDVNEAKKESAK